VVDRKLTATNQRQIGSRKDENSWFLTHGQVNNLVLSYRIIAL
jgi:hypothetical protein